MATGGTLNSFISSREQELTEQFLTQGYIVQSVEDMGWLQYIKSIVQPHEPGPIGDLNVIKLATMQAINSDSKARLAYYMLAKELLHVIVGNELSMQKKFNLNVQVPNDDKNLLPIHADTWTGDSAFQVVLWVPLVDCYRTKAMWILPPDKAKDFHLAGSSEEMFKRVESQVKYIDIKYGEVLLFNSTLPHGNRVNREDSTRWSLNCRFKSVFSPYGRKELGEHFEPITLRAASRVGLDYKLPGIQTGRYEAIVR